MLMESRSHCPGLADFAQRVQRASRLIRFLLDSRGRILSGEFARPSISKPWGFISLVSASGWNLSKQSGTAFQSSAIRKTCRHGTWLNSPSGGPVPMRSRRRTSPGEVSSIGWRPAHESAGDLPWWLRTRFAKHRRHETIHENS